MAAREEGLSSRCISLLEEVKGLIENQGSSGNVRQNERETASVSNSNRTSNVCDQVSINSNQVNQDQAQHQSKSRPESVMENFRSLFSPYAASSSTNNFWRPPPAKKSKKGHFQVKETWTHDFFCLASTTVTSVPSRMEKLELQNAGLGRKKVVFSCKASAFDVQRVLERVYPKLSETGGFELLRSGSPCTSLVLIQPPVTGGYSVPFLRDIAGLGQALAYIRPLQKDLDTASVVITEQVQDDNVPSVKCLQCEANVPMTGFRQHQAQCSNRKPSKSPVIDLDNGQDNQGLDDEQSVSTLKDIFTGKPSAEIEKAVRRSSGSIALAAQELLSDPEDAGQGVSSESPSTSRKSDVTSTSHSSEAAGTSSAIHVHSDSESESELTRSPFITSNTSFIPPATKAYSTLKELMHCHKLSLKLDEENVKRIRVCRDDFWHESIATFKNPQFDYTAAPSIKFEGEAGVDAGGLRREYGSLLCKAIFSAQANLFEGTEERKLPIYSIDGMYSRLFQVTGKMVAYLIIHLDIGIPCLSPAAYNYIATSSVTPDRCSVDDIVDLELKQLISQVNVASNDDDLNQLITDNEFLGNSLVTSGWLQPITIKNRHHAMQTLILHDVLTKRKEPLDQFCKGLEILGVHTLITSYPELMQAHFLSSAQTHLTSKDLIENLYIQEDDMDKLAKQFLIQSIQNLENEQGSTGLAKFLHFMTSRDKIPPLGLKCKIEVEFSESSNPTFFAETCAFVLRVPTVHISFESFQAKFLEACENYLGYGSV